MLLYIHIPFCDSKCFYCAFNSYTHLHSYKDIYLKGLKKQLKTQLQIQQKEIKTVFIGGGTPSTIEATEYEDIFKILKPYLKKDIEITIEANPNSASLSWLEGIFALGVNRISFGVQSFDEEKLQFLGRNHNQSQAIQAIQNAKKVGFEHINCDIIYDTKLDTKELLKSDLEIIKQLPIDHISAYSLTIEEGTKFFSSSDVQVENQFLARYLFKSIENLGFVQYEISNFAKNNTARSQHNLGYWEYEEYLGIGSGAVGCINNQRLYSKKDIQEYIQDPIGYEQIEILSSEDINIEKILLGFRSVVGVDIEQLTQKQKEKIKYLLEENKVVQRDNKLFAVDYLIADELALFLDS